jgi:hypothetical protein
MLAEKSSHGFVVAKGGNSKTGIRSRAKYWLALPGTSDLKTAILPIVTKSFKRIGIYFKPFSGDYNGRKIPL